MIRIATIALLIAMLMVAAGCGGGSSSGSNSGSNFGSQSTAMGVVVTPSAVGNVLQGTTVQFTALVGGQSSQAVVWSVREGSAGGIIDSTGLYTAPSAAGTFHVVATSHADPKASGTGFVEVPALTVLISPAAETLRIGGQRQFGAYANAANQNVTWKLEEGATGGTITGRGLYTAPAAPGTFHVTAVAVFNSNVSTTAPVTIVTTGFAPLGDMATTRSGHTATLLRDGHVLVAGGTTDATHSAELFAPAGSSFTPVSGGMIHVRAGHCAALLPAGKVLIAGGDDSNGVFFNTAELFDPAMQNFTATGDLNQARTGATATLLPGGKVLIAGGRDSGGTVLSTAELYDPATGIFSLTGNMHSPRVQHTATLLTNGKVLLVGSRTDTGNAELFDPASGLFSATGSLMQARAHHTATLLPNGQVAVFGGIQIRPPAGGGAAAAPVSLDSAEVYDPADGVFHTAGKLLIPRDSHSATLLANGIVLVAGGYSHGFDGDAQPFFNTMFAGELIDPATFASTPAPSLEGSRAEHVATILNNGLVLVTGGRSGSVSSLHTSIRGLASAELYR